MLLHLSCGVKPVSQSLTKPKFVLYHYAACPFCAITRSAIDYLDVEVEERDILKHNVYRSELLSGGGKAQVPCLKIEVGEQSQWLYESKDIVQYLRQYVKSQ